jgi:TPR repeat protein
MDTCYVQEIYMAELVKNAEHYRRAAEQGDATAQFNLGLCYDEGAGVGQDFGQALYWYTKAAEQGLAIAQKTWQRRRLRREGLGRSGAGVGSAGFLINEG